MVNSILPRIADKEGIRDGNGGGWCHELSELLMKDPETELFVFYPQKSSRTVVRGRAGELRYFGFYEEPSPELRYDKALEESLRAVLRELSPDIVHIWGTEYVHTLCMLRAYGRPERTVISIQGLIYFIGEKYTELLPERVIRRHTFRDLIRKDSILEQKLKFLKRGEFELAALRESRNVIGRTRWDHDTVMRVNPGLKYFHGSEFLRRPFYDGEGWRYSECEKHSVFMSQSYYPVKGMHIALLIIKELKKKYSDVRLYAAGKGMIPHGLKEWLKRDSYSKYICECIKDYGLEDNICFTGSLNAEEMKERYLRSNVYLQPSVMENSSNSLGEAMILGVPCVASDAGGTGSMLRDGIDGFLYPFDEPARAAEYISELFEAGEAVQDMCESAAEYAGSLYDINKGYLEYKGIYRELMCCSADDTGGRTDDSGLS